MVYIPPLRKIDEALYKPAKPKTEKSLFGWYLSVVLLFVLALVLSGEVSAEPGRGHGHGHEHDSGTADSVPVTVTESMRSFMRLKQRSSVDLPQPEGPMKAVTFFSGTSRSMSWRAWACPYHKISRQPRQQQ